MFYTYILYSKRIQKFYVGSTDNPDRRLIEHNNGMSKYTSTGIPWEMIWNREHESRTEAIRLEKEIKKRGASRFLNDLKMKEGLDAGRSATPQA